MAEKVSARQHEEIEKRETPAYEAREHEPSFLKKAERLAERKKGKRSGGRR